MIDKVPVTSPADVKAELPTIIKQSQNAPVRDALTAAMAEMFKAHQDASKYAADQASVDRATGIYLAGLASDHGIVPASGESNDSLRSRIFDAPLIVTPQAIINAINAIVLPYTTVRPQIFEEIDCNFITDDTASFDSSFVSANPRYPDRLYEDDAAENDGYSRPQSQPGGFWTFGDEVGRYFVIRLPPLEAADEDFAFLEESFISDNTNASGSELDGTDITFVFGENMTADELYAAVVTAVEKIKGQGFRFQVYVDPELT